MTYTLFAGVNGAGKSSLHKMLTEECALDFGKRINVDDIAASLGDWRDAKVQFQAGKLAVKFVKDSMEQRIAFNQESTLSGRTIITTMNKAKKLGYKINMYYIYLESAQLAKDRVSKRVQQGGHGIPDSDIERRYAKSLENLKFAAPLCDKLIIYDNSMKLNNVATFNDGRLVKMQNFINPTLMRIIACIYHQ